MIRASDASGIEAAVALLRAGQRVAIPSETVYGLAADAFNAQACAGIFEDKDRPAFDPLIVHILDFDWLLKVAHPGPHEDILALLNKRFWPGPLTVVLPKNSVVPDVVCAGLETVAVRIPSHPTFRAILSAFGSPLAAPSANLFGCLSPTTAAHVEEQLGEVIPMILDGGPSAVGVESSILDLSGAQPRLLRAGGVSLEDLESALGRPIEMGEAVLERPLAPGQLASHYAPLTPLSIHAPGDVPVSEGRAGLLSFKGSPLGSRFAEVEVLSQSGDFVEAASRLFAALHRLDDAELDHIYVEAMPEIGLGRAIMDRLRKAEAKQ